MKIKILFFTLVSFLTLACAAVSGATLVATPTELPGAQEMVSPDFTSTPDLASASADPSTLSKENYRQFKTLYKWSLKDDTTVAKVNGIVISSETERVALLTQASNKYTLRVYDLQGGLIWEVSLPTKAAEHSALSFSPDGNLIAVGLDNGEVQIWDTNKGELFTSVHYHMYTTHALAFSPDRVLIASGASDQKAKIWILDTGLEISDQGNVVNVYDLAFSPNGRYLAISSAEVVIVVDTQTGQEAARYWDRDRATKNMFEVAFSSDGKKLASSSKLRGNRYAVLIWDFPSSTQSPTALVVDDFVEDLVFSSNNDLIIGSYRDKNKIGFLKIFDLQTHDVIGQLPLGPKLYMSYTNDLTMFIVLSEKKDVDIWGIPE